MAVGFLSSVPMNRDVSTAHMDTRSLLRQIGSVGADDLRTVTCVVGGGRYPSKIWVEKLDEDVQRDSFDREFLWQNALYPCRVTIRDSETWDDWRYYQLFRHETLVERNNANYIIGFEAHERVTELPPVVNEYLQEIEITPTEHSHPAP